ncbi:aminotransferase class I/II-fold pyridoxal phosphate-dependent enzyme [Zeaxanthinibacter sp. PT1]|uniref:aminotransferase class I/II-fold pyridoxal phosphate-dependent enzyme n=1 Tax=Zeaxanthinibacter TaxID=561554 RepID=UPI00234920F2|nr:aminotransferase class I/II-fold pyridoxal phosphate-dependent enzyme [Zeaxanthinibacter sp. PT1]MDC6351060.1 aminotransferase class I/II-fold pyridoxal phosphate-dependent enzyme [Zeaxanthinibacter sp. PT1]
MGIFPKKLTRKLADREASNALRSLGEKEEKTDFYSNDYLGFARHAAIHTWASQLVAEANTTLNGATGSRLLSGNHNLYLRLEEYLDRYYGQPSLIFNSGYDANTGFFSSVPQRGDVVLYDELAHASIRDGIRMGLAKSYKFEHNDLQDLRSQILMARKRSNTLENGAVKEDHEIYVVTESVFSMDGDSPDLEEMSKLCSELNCRLVVDEAHAIGVCGENARGTAGAGKMQNDVFARILTFGKGMGAHGAAVIGPAELRLFLLNYARSFIYTTALPPHSVATVLASYHFMDSPEGQKKQWELKENIRYFREQLQDLSIAGLFIPSNSAIHCCLLPGNDRVKAVAAELQLGGFDVRPILSPTVPGGQERLRFCLHSYNTFKEIKEVLRKLATSIADHE